MSCSKNFKKTNNSTLKLVGSKMHEACPYQLLRVCSYIDNLINTSIKMNVQISMRQFTAAQIKILLFSLKDT